LWDAQPLSPRSSPRPPSSPPTPPSPRTRPGKAVARLDVYTGWLIGRRGGPRHGPPHPPTLGRAPAKPWRASTSTQDGSSARFYGPFLTRVASGAFIPPPSDRLALGPGGSHGTPGKLAGWESSGISQDGGGRGGGDRRRGRDPGHRRGAEGPELSEGDEAQRSGMGELRPGLRRRVQASRG